MEELALDPSGRRDLAPNDQKPTKQRLSPIHTPHKSFKLSHPLKSCLQSRQPQLVSQALPPIPLALQGDAHHPPPPLLTAESYNLLIVNQIYKTSLLMTKLAPTTPQAPAALQTSPRWDPPTL